MVKTRGLGGLGGSPRTKNIPGLEKYRFGGSSDPWSDAIARYYQGYDIRNAYKDYIPSPPSQGMTGGPLGQDVAASQIGYRPSRPRIGYDEQIFPKPGDYDALKAEEWDMEQQQQLQDWQRPQELGYPDLYEQLVGYRPDQVGPTPGPYANQQLEQNPVYPERLVPQMPPGWQPPPTLRQRIERGLEAQRQRRTSEPPAEFGNPVLRRKKPKRPKARESEA